VKSLEKAGHSVISWGTTLHKDLVNCIEKLYFLDGGQSYYDIFEDGMKPPTQLMKWLLDRARKTPSPIVDSWQVEKPRQGGIPHKLHKLLGP
jgi:hypothetical protein